jgi:hypothetical protein
MRQTHLCSFLSVCHQSSLFTSYACTYACLYACPHILCLPFIPCLPSYPMLAPMLAPYACPYACPHLLCLPNTPKLAPMLALTVGEALAHVVGSVPVSQDRVLRGNFTSLAGKKGCGVACLHVRVEVVCRLHSYHYCGGGMCGGAQNPYTFWPRRLKMILFSDVHACDIMCLSLPLQIRALLSLSLL